MFFWSFLQTAVLFLDDTLSVVTWPFRCGDRHLKENMYMLNELQCSGGWNAATELDHHGFRSKAFATIFERNCITSLLVPTVTLNQWSSTKGVKLLVWLPKHVQVLQLSLQPLPLASWKNMVPRWIYRAEWTKFKTSAKRGASSGRVSCQKHRQVEFLPPVPEQRRRAA